MATATKDYDEEPDMGADEAESGDYDYDEPMEEGEEDEE